MTEAGGVATNSQGDLLDLNRHDGTSMGHRGVLFASNEALAQALRAATPAWQALGRR